MHHANVSSVPLKREQTNQAAALHPSQPASADELDLLREENSLLMARVEELERLFEAGGPQTDAIWASQQREYEMLLEEKSEVIRDLHQKLAELRDTAARTETAQAPVVDDAKEREDLARLRQELAERRAQLEEDEETMMAQMRQLEMALAKDRADLARQRAEVQRLHNEFVVETETAQRGDVVLRERLGAFQRRPGVNQRRQNAASAAQPEEAPAPPAETKPASSGLLKRIFG